MNKQKTSPSRIHHRISPNSYRYFKSWHKTHRPLKEITLKHRLFHSEFNKSQGHHNSKSDFELASKVHSVSRNEAPRNANRSSDYVYMKHKAENLRTISLSNHPELSYDVLKSKIKSRNATQSNSDLDMFDTDDDYDISSTKISLPSINRNKGKIPSPSAVNNSSLIPNIFKASDSETSFFKIPKQDEIFQSPLPLNSAINHSILMSARNKTKVPFLMVTLTTTKPFRVTFPPFMFTNNSQLFVPENGERKLFENNKPKLNIPAFISTEYSRAEVFSTQSSVSVTKSEKFPFVLSPSTENNHQINGAILSAPLMSNIFEDQDFTFNNESSGTSKIVDKKPVTEQMFEHQDFPATEFDRIPAIAHIKTNTVQQQYESFSSHNMSNIFETVNEEPISTPSVISSTQGGNRHLPIWFLPQQPVLSDSQKNKIPVHITTNPEMSSFPLPMNSAIVSVEKGKFPTTGTMSPGMISNLYKFPFNIYAASEKNKLKQVIQHHENGKTEANTTIPSSLQYAHNKLKGIIGKYNHKYIMFTEKSILKLLTQHSS